MSKWQPIETAPRDGTPLLLWARLKSKPPTGDDFHPIVEFWHRSIDRWKVTPEDLNSEDDLIATYWIAIPEPPK
jgi:hypothetical protein